MSDEQQTPEPELPEPDPVAEAWARGHAAALAELNPGPQLAAARVQAVAWRRNARYDADALVERLDLDRLVDEDGRPNETAIARVVETFVPAVDRWAGAPSFDGGARTTARLRVPGMNEVIAEAAMQSRWHGRPSYLSS